MVFQCHNCVVPRRGGRLNIISENFNIGVGCLGNMIACGGERERRKEGGYRSRPLW